MKKKKIEWCLVSQRFLLTFERIDCVIYESVSFSLILWEFIIYLQSVKLLARTLKSLQSCLTLCNPMDCSPPGSSVHGILQARTLEWVPFPPPGESSRLRHQTASLMSPALAGRFFTTCATGKPLSQPCHHLNLELGRWSSPFVIVSLGYFHNIPSNRWIT